ncbi:endonuclease domain-containing protein [Zobellia galactanivorans]|uniref:endonuclease domain-containing protein n=1 Tax=Zobellia galactanivorans (strain DSM 12802 / CCUG 47099 / CIP 106680 / NCIMB 13871 / Dsij) TaxID=63186 RepID=UPI001C064A90|nr:DUF559 domain-containing protein [Zobellia galactanivorans]MBU3026109.1 DUF559 domain-containing protein [Zobellia galactanivorans]
MIENKLSELRERLENIDSFRPVLNYFLKKSIAEQSQISDDSEGISYSEFFSPYIENSSRINADIVSRNCESPIERIFMNSLILLFIKNQFIDLVITEPYKDAEKEISNIRIIHKNILSIIEDYKKKTGDFEMVDFESSMKKRIKSGVYTNEDYELFQYHRVIVKNFVWNSYHITLQAGFPEFKIDNKSTRVDLLVWKPNDESFKLIVECDGFKYHNTKDAFVKDRKRDRLYKSKGYQVIRFSGTEIWKDPAAVSSELYDFIENYESRINI